MGCRANGAVCNRMEIDVDAVATSVNGAAKALSLGRTSIYALIREGRLKAVKVGRRTLITTESIRALIDPNRSEPPNH